MGPGWRPEYARGCGKALHAFHPGITGGYCNGNASTIVTSLTHPRFIAANIEAPSQRSPFVPSVLQKGLPSWEAFILKANAESHINCKTQPSM
jgi:hypothetical protein